MGVTLLRHDYATVRPMLDHAMTTQAQLVFADPPYNLGVDYEGAPSDSLGREDYRRFCNEVVRQLWYVTAPGGTLWWLHPAEDVDWMTKILTRHFPHRRHLVVWHERFAQYQQKTLTQDFRLLYCHQKEGGEPTFNPDAIREESERQRMGDKRADPRGRVPGCVWRVRRLQGTAKDRVDWHPVQLPPEPLERIILGWTDPGDTVLDAFAGSGNMALQCLKHDREFVGVDASAKYIAKIMKRVQMFQAGLADRGV